MSLNEAKRLYKQGEQKLAAGDLQGAIAKFKQALQFYPQHYSSLNLLGCTLLMLERYEEAIARFDQALQYKPGSYETCTNCSAALAGLGRYEEALVILDQALHYKPDHPSIWRNRGNVLAQLGRSQESLDSFDQALRYEPDHSETWCNRGVALEQSGQREEAIANFDRALELDPNHSSAWCNRGAALNNLKRYQEALESAERGITLQPEKARGWYVKGFALDGLTRYEEAIASYDRALYYEPGDCSAWTGRGNTLTNLGRHEEAISNHDQALHYQPNYHETWRGRGAALTSLGCYKEAISDYDRALQLKPDYPEAWGGRGAALANLGRYEEAISNYDQALSLKPDFPGVWINRGLAALYSFSSPMNQGWSNPTLVAASLPPDLQNPDLDLRGYEGCQASIQEGFKHSPEGSEGWGQLHRALGEAHRLWGNCQASPFDFWCKAITCYNQALDIFTADTFPQARLEVLALLIRTYRALRENDEVVAALVRQGTALLERILRESPSDAQKQRLGLQFASFEQATVDLFVQQGDLITALETAEKDKNWLMTWLLRWQDQDEIATANYAAMRQLLRPDTAIVYWHYSPDALTTFILRQDSPQPIVISRAQDDSKAGIDQVNQLERWLQDWNHAYTRYLGKDKTNQTKTNPNRDETWRTDMTQRLFERQEASGNLKEILNIDQIEPHLDGIHHLILVPHRDLHRFPLHALLSDRFSVSYLPSLQVGLNLQGRQPTDTSYLLSIENPASDQAPDMRLALVESQMIRQQFQNLRSLQAAEVTHAKVIDALAEKHTIFHFSGHGSHQFENPKQSALLLAGTERLTLEDICQQDLTTYDLVSLSACETALTNNQSITTEYVGLVSGFLRQGAAQVLSTLWVVKSAVSAVVMIQFYRTRQPGKPDSLALSETIQWFRSLNQSTFEQWCQDCLQELANLPQEEQRDIKRMFDLHIRYRWDTIKEEIQQPYAWAPFTLSGGFFP